MHIAGIHNNNTNLLKVNASQSQYYHRFPWQGLYPESHGIVGPEMYDTKLNKTFRAGKYESYQSYWWKGEAIWNTIKKQVTVRIAI